MPAPRPVLIDLALLGLDPRAHHRTLVNGHIAARTVGTAETVAPAPAPSAPHGPLMPTTTHAAEAVTDVAEAVVEPAKKKGFAKKKAEEKPEES